MCRGCGCYRARVVAEDLNMAVKPGDLAIVHLPSDPDHGRIVDVLAVSPPHDFLLPDNTRSQGSADTVCYVCKGIGAPLHALTLANTKWVGWYASFCATTLRPLPGDETPESERHTEEVSA